MKEINAEIISVGTELLLGQIANTNAQWISKQLAQEGVNVLYHKVVGDNLNRVEESFKQAGKRSDVIIITGGLGPTDDDLTREAFQNLSHMHLIEDQFSMSKIVDYFNQQGTDMTSNNRKQARVFEKAQILENKIGMAPGMILNYLNKTWVFLPGVPPEMKQMIMDDVIPYIKKLYGQDVVIKSTLLRFIGIGEAKLEDELKEIIRTQTNPTIALLSQNDGIIARLTAKAESNEQANHLLLEMKNKVESKVGHHLYGIDFQTLEKKVISMLKERRMTISTAESLTGGMFSEALTKNPGASKVFPGGIVAYSSGVKNKVLGVSLDVIEEKGVVSSECAIEMALRARELLQTDIGLGLTGVAGPDKSEGHEPGTFYIALSANEEEVRSEKFIVHGNRNMIRRRAVIKGFEMIYYFLENH